MKTLTQLPAKELTVRFFNAAFQEGEHNALPDYQVSVKRANASYTECKAIEGEVLRRLQRLEELEEKIEELERAAWQAAG